MFYRGRLHRRSRCHHGRAARNLSNRGPRRGRIRDRRTGRGLVVGIVEPLLSPRVDTRSKIMQCAPELFKCLVLRARRRVFRVLYTRRRMRWSRGLPGVRDAIFGDGRGWNVLTSRASSGGVFVRAWRGLRILSLGLRWPQTEHDFGILNLVMLGQGIRLTCLHAICLPAT